jgi:hypothetical protein
VAIALDLPEDYFPEYRESVVLEHVKKDVDLRDEIYGRIAGSSGARKSRRG